MDSKLRAAYEEGIRLGGPFTRDEVRDLLDDIDDLERKIEDLNLELEDRARKIEDLSTKIWKRLDTYKDMSRD